MPPSPTRIAGTILETPLAGPKGEAHDGPSNPSSDDGGDAFIKFAAGERPPDPDSAP